VLLLGTIMAAVVYWPGRHQEQPVLSSLRLGGLDPMIRSAVEEAQDAVRAAPESGAAWGKLGQILYVHGVDGAAAESFARASQLAPNEARWPYLRGRAVKRENGDAALPFLTRAAELCRGSPAAPSLTLAELLLERGNTAPAQVEIDAVLARDPSDPRALLDRARLHVAAGRWKQAQADLDASIGRAPDVKASHMLLASAYGRAGDAAAARREQERARTLPEDPHWPDPFVEELSALAIGRSAVLQRARFLLNQGHTPQAILMLEAVAAQYPQDAQVWVALGKAYERDGQGSRAESAFRRATAERADASEAYLRLGMLLCDQQRFGDAMTPLRQAARLDPNLPETHYRLGLCLLKLGDRSGAIAALQDAVRVEPSFREGYVALGRALNDGGRSAEAAVQLRRALELEPNDAPTAALLKQLESPR
jgi:tetratricopeptide (TPR) repeat protein